MLIITRKIGESFFIDDVTEVIINDIVGEKVKIAIDAPKNVHILRSELVKIAQENKDSVSNLSDDAKNFLKGRFLKK
ncbi:MAG: carbon storage regulator [Ruminococcus sp.]|nr:carbon storage regulator [Ruminococcus sp.]